MEAVEDPLHGHVPFLMIDLILFGQPIPANEERRFSSWSNVTDIMDNLPGIVDGDS